MVNDLVQFLIFILLIVIATPLLGVYMAQVFEGERTLLTPLLRPVEHGLYRLAGIAPDARHSWLRYAFAVLGLNLAGCLLLYAILRFQHLLPWNPQQFPPLRPDLAFNTAVSFVTNTNWQAYGGETTLSYFSQMAGLTVQNFVSAATGMAVAVAVIRGFAGRALATLGNFYVDLTRAILYILLPLAFLAAIFLMSEGVIQNLSPYVTATTLEGGEQVIAQGPAASQVAIKQLGTNGGGFFNANSAHPYENPTPLSNLLECVFILMIPAAFCVTFGRMVRDGRQGRALFMAMAVLFLGGLALTYGAEIAGNPLLNDVPLSGDGNMAPGNMEGKEVRFGVGLSALWATATTAASNGSVNAMHESLMPLGALAPLLNIQLGEVVFGGVGAGIYGMLLFVVLTVFIAGLMVGRTPEYLGKKIEAREVKLAIFALLSLPVGILLCSAIAVLSPEGLAALHERGPHAWTELLYAYSSATGNNGSAFAGFNADSPFHNTLLGLVMLLGRYAFIVPVLAIAGSVGGKKTVPQTAGTFPTHGALFVSLLVSVVLIVGGLTFFPVLALGPFAEHFAMIAGRSF